MTKIFCDICKEPVEHWAKCRAITVIGAGTLHFSLKRSEDQDVCERCAPKLLRDAADAQDMILLHNEEALVGGRKIQKSALA